MFTRILSVTTLLFLFGVQYPKMSIILFFLWYMYLAYELSVDSEIKEKVNYNERFKMVATNKPKKDEVVVIDYDEENKEFIEQKI